MGFSTSVALSQLLVAFTIEFDDSFEQRMPHHTGRGPAAHSGRGPFLVSRAMWANCLRWIPSDGLPEAEFSPLAELTNRSGLLRWGYLSIDDQRARLTPAGAEACRVWTGLTGEVEDRWSTRFGAKPVAALREALRVMSDPALPSALPVIGRHATNQRLRGWNTALPPGAVDEELPTLLARVVMGYALRYEAASSTPLHLAANALRVIPRDGIGRAEISLRAGISREATALSVGQLVTSGLVTLGTVIELTDEGAEVQRAHRSTQAAAESTWSSGLSRAAAALLDQTDALAEGLRPHPQGWRAHPPYRTQTRGLLAGPTERLPNFPMVLHRGGYPDGS